MIIEKLRDDTYDFSPAGAARLAVIVVNFGSHALLAQNLRPVEAVDATIVVVDNFSTAQERSAIITLACERGWTLVRQPGNPGFGAGVNAGVGRAIELGCDTFVSLNPDAQVSVAVLEELKTHTVSEPMSLVSPTIRTPAGAVEFGGAWFDLRSGRIRNIRWSEQARPAILRLDAAGSGAPSGASIGVHQQGWLTGACTAFSKTLFEATGGYDESFFLYWEDVDFSYRAEQAGAALVVRRDLVVTHAEGGTQRARSGRAKSPLYYQYNCQNRLRFAASRLPRRVLLRWLAQTPAVSWEILMRGGRRQLLNSPRGLASAALGTGQGARLAVNVILGRKMTTRRARLPFPDYVRLAA